MRKTLLTLSIIWVTTIAGFYFYYHSYFRIVVQKTVNYFFQSIFVLSIIAAFFIYKRYINKEKTGQIKVSILSIVLIISALFVGHTTYLYYYHQPSIYSGPNLIAEKQEGTNKQTLRYLKSTEKTLPKNSKLVLGRGEIAFNDVLVKKLKAQGMSDHFSKLKLKELVKNLTFSYLNSVLPILLTALLAYIIGFNILKFFFRKKIPDAENPIGHISAIAFGYLAIIAIGFTLGIFGVFTTAVIRIISLVIVILCIPSLKQIGKNLVATKKIEFKYVSLTTLIFFIMLMSLLHFIFGTIHDIPIGIDGARVYVKIAYDIINSGNLPIGYASYNAGILWSFASLLTFKDIQSVMFIPFVSAILTFVTMYFIGKKHLNCQTKPLLLFILALGSTAMTFFLTILDHKTEYFALFYGVLGIYFLLEWAYNKQKSLISADIFLAALFLGVAFISKMTFVILLCAVLVFLFRHFWGRLGTLAGFLFGITAIIFSGKLKIPGVDLNNEMISLLSLVFLVLVIAAFVWIIIKYRQKTVKPLISIIIFGAILMLPILPWMGIHYVESKSFSVNKLLFGQKETPLDESKIRAGYNCGGGLANETDYGRYISYDTDPVNFLKKYFTLPWEMTMNVLNPNSNTTDIGFLALALSPIFLLLYFLQDKKRKIQLTIYIGLLVWAVWSALTSGFMGALAKTFGRKMPNGEIELHPFFNNLNNILTSSTALDIIGIAAFIGLLIVPLIYLLIASKEETKKTALGGLIIIGVFAWIFWIFVSPGVTWYGIAALALLFLILAATWPDRKKYKIYSVLAAVACIFYLLNTSNYHIARVEKIYLGIGTGVLTEGKFFDLAFPHYREILDIMKNEEYFLKNNKYVLKAGGSMEFFMIKGQKIVLSDNHMDFISCGLEKHNGNAKEFLSELKKRGVEYIFISKAIFEDQREIMRDRYKNAFVSFAPLMKTHVNSSKIYFGQIPDKIEDLNYGSSLTVPN